MAGPPANSSSIVILPDGVNWTPKITAAPPVARRSIDVTIIKDRERTPVDCNQPSHLHTIREGLEVKRYLSSLLRVVSGAGEYGGQVKHCLYSEHPYSHRSRTHVAVNTCSGGETTTACSAPAWRASW
jgi:hypothetical protein